MLSNMPTRFVRKLAKALKIKDWETESIARLRCKLEDKEVWNANDALDIWNQINETTEDTFSPRT